MTQKEYCYVCGSEIEGKATYKRDGPLHLPEAHCNECC